MLRALLVGLLLVPVAAKAQLGGGAALVLPGGCGTAAYTSGAAPLTVDSTGRLCTTDPFTAPADGRTGGACFASSFGKLCFFEMRATSSSIASTRLTTDGQAAGAVNCVNLAAGSAYVLSIDVVAVDATAPTSYGATLLARGTIARPTNAASTVVTMNSAGTNVGTGVYPTFTADTTNGCLNVSVTPGNTDTWHWLARVMTAEVQ